MTDVCVSQFFFSRNGYGAGILPTILYPHKKNVDNENKRFFDRLVGDLRVYECCDFASSNRANAYLRQLDRTGIHPILETKTRMQVMLKTNMNVSQGLCNGSRGVILGYKPFKTWYAGIDENEMKRRYPGQATSRLPEWGKRFTLVPYVLFSNGLKVLVGPHVWSRSFDNGKLTVSRLQIPLIPAWALTIHKVSSLSEPRAPEAYFKHRGH